MTNDELDRILSEDEILPSSGFASAVMDTVRREASAPPPIPFPWKRIRLGLVVSGLALLWALGSLAKMVIGAAAQSTDINAIPQIPALHAVINAETAWVTLALFVTLASVRFSMRLASGPGR